MKLILNILYGYGGSKQRPCPCHAGQLRWWGSLGNQRAGLVTSFLWNSEGGGWNFEAVRFVKYFGSSTELS